MQGKEQKIIHYDKIAPHRDRWRQKNRYYYRKQEELLTFLFTPKATLLEIGCSTGELLYRLQPSRGVGIDISPAMVNLAQQRFPAERFPHLDFRVDDAEQLEIREIFDYVLLADTLGDFTDIWTAFRNLHQVTGPHSRVIITYFNSLWEPFLKLGERLGVKMPQPYQNWLAPADLVNLLTINGFEVISQGNHLLLPKYFPMVAWLANSLLAKLPGLRKCCLTTHLVARPCLPREQVLPEHSVSVIVPCRNEKGNIRAAVARIPQMGSHTEIIFVDGNSNDGTVAEIEAVIDENRDRLDIKLIHQVPPDSDDGNSHGKMLKLGKGDAVRKGFAAAEGEILMILDADLTVPPEDLPKFYAALREGHGEFINGTRLVYPMEKEAMRFLNKLANKFFSQLFSWLLNQRIKDTLCGTKVLFKRDYEKIAANRDYFGDFDPFGDFDLLFGAAKQNLKIVEIPIRYRERIYGEIKIERFRHGLLLLKMSWLAFTKFKLR